MSIVWSRIRAPRCAFTRGAAIGSRAHQGPRRIPERQITMIVSFPPAAGSDIGTADQHPARRGAWQAVIVRTVAAPAAISAWRRRRARGDGYTLPRLLERLRGQPEPLRPAPTIRSRLSYRSMVIGASPNVFGGAGRSRRSNPSGADRQARPNPAASTGRGRAPGTTPSRRELSSCAPASACSTSRSRRRPATTAVLAGRSMPTSPISDRW